ncbi:MAG: nucleotidyltransferase domain-containing protein [Pseudomonadota bacterium]|nr:nucleotidyltransferase domain-containing protein [Pseudomonadota bacterium]
MKKASFKQILEMSDKIVAGFHPVRIVLFGSYASGEASENSDVDLLVIMPSVSGRNVSKAIEIIKHIRPEFPVDILVRSAEEVQRRLAMNDFFFQEINAKGAVLYEADNKRVD